MQIQTRGTPLMHGWLTDSIRLVKKAAGAVTGGGGTTVNVQPAASAESDWKMPALLGGAGLIALLLLRKK